ncbi:PQQ-binding-like beta-propeller repeat protein, partial [bacterium]|nr:PQQ-binding-like beta-propeller repeat protein [bacterium]
NPDGTLKWKFQLLADDNTSPALGFNDNLYLCSSDSESFYLFSINSSGIENWRVKLDKYVYAPPIIWGPQPIYVIASGNLYAINFDGSQKWVINVGGPTYSSPIIADWGLMYVGSSDNCVYAIGDINAPTKTPTRTPTRTPTSTRNPTETFTPTPKPTSGDFIAPTVNLISPQNGEQVTGIFPVTVEATDASGIASVDVNINGAEWRQCVKTDDYWIFKWNTTVYENQKTISLQARAKDKSVNSNIGYSSTINVTTYNEKAITFNIEIKDKTSFSSGDDLKLLIDLATNSLPQTIDLYFVMIHPSTQLYSYIHGGWASGLYPILIKFEMPTNLDIKDAVLLNMKLPSNSPPINSFGNYIFAIAAVEYNTDYFVSNIATASFEYK